MKSAIKHVRAFVKDAIADAEDIHEAIVNNVKSDEKLKYQTFDNFITTGKLNYRNKNNGICVFGDDDGSIYEISADGEVTLVCIEREWSRKKRKTTIAHKQFVGWICADEDTVTFINDGDISTPDALYVIENYPTISVTCLSRFFSKYSVNDLATRRVGLGLIQNIEIVDFSYDEISMDVNATHRGFTTVYSALEDDYVMHKPGSVLVKHKGRTILFGSDEGSYFGCELPVHAKSIDEAYDCLIPKEAKNKKYVRQGEWFAVPVKDKDVPSIDQSFIGRMPSYVLPMLSEDDNPHYVDGNVRVTSNKEGKPNIYVKGYIEHEQHEILALDTWHQLYRNTAVLSFSQEGVD